MAIKFSDGITNNNASFITVSASNGDVQGVYFVDTIAARDALGSADSSVDNHRTTRCVVFVGTTAYVYTGADIADATWQDANNWSALTGASSGVQSDWDETDAAEESFILNKPTLFSGAYADLTGLPTLFSGNYNDLTNKPVLFDGQYSSLSGLPTLFSGSYNDLTDQPSLFSGSWIDLTNKPQLFDGDYNSLTNLPALFDYDYNSLINTPTLFSGSWNDLTDKPTLFDGSYNSLTDTPTLFDGAYSSLTGIPSTFAPSAHTHTASEITDFSTAADARIAAADLQDLSNVVNSPVSGQFLTWNGASWVTQAIISGDTNVQSDWTESNTNSDAFIQNKPTLFSGAYADLTGLPTLFDGDYNSLTNLPTLTDYVPFTGAGASVDLNNNNLSGVNTITASAALFGNSPQNLRAFNIRGTGFDGRLSLQGGSGDNPGIEMTTDGNSTRVLQRLQEVGTSGTSLETYTELDGGAIGLRTTVDDDGTLYLHDTTTKNAGIRNNSGTMQFKNAAGTWTDMGSGSGSSVQADWDETDSADPSFINNKPTVPSVLNDLSNVSATPLTGDVLRWNGTSWSADTPADVGEANVQADWNETDISSDAYIRNKPTSSLVLENHYVTTSLPAANLTGGASPVDFDTASATQQTGMVENDSLGTHFTYGAGSFIVGADGLFTFTLTAEFTSSTSGVTIASTFRVNGVEIESKESTTVGASSEASLSMTRTLNLSSGDRVTVYTENTGTSSGSAVTANMFLVEAFANSMQVVGIDGAGEPAYLRTEMGSAYLAGGASQYSWSSGTLSKVPGFAQAEKVGTSISFNSSLERFEVGIDGLYTFTVTAFLQEQDGHQRPTPTASFYLNGVQQDGWGHTYIRYAQSANEGSINLTRTFNLSAGDYIEVYNQNTGHLPAPGFEAAALHALVECVHLGVSVPGDTNVQSDWTETSAGSDSFIANKPTLGTAASFDSSDFAPATHTHTHNDITDFDTEVNALIAAAGGGGGGETNVQADWTELDSASDAFILNKPSLGTAALQDSTAFATASHSHTTADITDITNSPTTGEYLKWNGNVWVTDSPSGGTGGGEDNVQADWNETDQFSDAFIVNKPTLFNGDYNSLINKPTLFDGQYSSLTGTPTLFSGSYDDLTNTPVLFDGNYNSLTNVPLVFTPDTHTHTASEITDFNSAADSRIAAADLQDLSNVTTTPSTDGFLKWDGTSWVTDTSAGGTVERLNDIGNVSAPTNSAADGKFLYYNHSVSQYTIKAITTFEPSDINITTDGPVAVLSDFGGGAKALFIKYFLNGSSQRAGELYVVSDGTTATITDTSTPSLGTDFTEPEFSVTQYAGGLLSVTVSFGNGYNFKGAAITLD